ncbi:MAG: FkbM family methyltransferase [Verrucomicrobia bacterium]|nr:FkbM family methyltransferase [Verrucomicrobiota bacterium]
MFRRLLRLPLRLVPGFVRMPILSGPLRGKRWIVGSSIHDAWLGNYEADKQALFARTVTPGSVVFDVGAHAGFYTLLASALTGPTGRVFAFEPMPNNIAHLREHLRLNGAANVTVIEKAVADASGVATFTACGSNFQGHLLPGGELQVETVSLDELVEQGRLPLPDFVKMDIEGAEVRALNGARKLLARRHPTVFLGTHAMTDLGCNTHEPCCRLLRDLGYRLVPIGADTLDATDEILAVYGP